MLDRLKLSVEDVLDAREEADVDNLKFIPNIELASGTRVRSGDSHTLLFSKGIGIIDVWVGGKIKISSTQKNGDYTGRFTLNVSY